MHASPIHSTTTRAPHRRQPRRAAPGLFLAIATASTLFGPVPARAQWFAEEDRIRLAYAPKAFHFDPDPAHVEWNNIVALELVSPRHTFWRADRSHFGVSLFDNSYGQFSQSVYAGLEWNLTRLLDGDVFASVSAGFVHGYSEPYQDKVPFNDLGIAPALIPALGWQGRNLGFALSLFGGSAVTLRVSYTFDR